VDHYWDVTHMAVSVFGRFYVGIHLIVGLGETEKEMVDAIQHGQDLGPLPIFSPSFLRKEVPWRNIPPLLLVSTGESSLPAGSLMNPWDRPAG